MSAARYVTLGDIAEVNWGDTSVTKASYVESGFPAYSAAGCDGFLPYADHDREAIVLSAIGSCGRTWFATGKWSCIKNTIVFWSKSQEVDNRYLYWATANEEFWPRRGASQPFIALGDARKVKVLIVPPHEQRRIAAILDQADALRAKRREALAQLDSLTQSIFIEMFGDPRQLPSSWPSSPLKALGRVTTGRTPPSSKEGMFGGDVPFITPGDLESEDPAKRTLTAEGVAEVNPVRAGAALVCCIGTVGKMGAAKVRSAFNQQINAVDWCDAVDDVYGLAALRFLKSELAAQAASTTVPILNKSAFERFEIPVPPLVLQRTFATRIKGVEALKATHSAALAESDALFASLQHRAFSGSL